MVWRPDVTVAAIIEREGRFLFVEEYVGDRLVINQPAGHLEPNESFSAAVIRETLEETAWTFVPEAVSGIYLWPHPERNLTFLRVTFCGQVTQHHAERRLDRGIRRTLWLSRQELEQRQSQLRSPMVIKCMDDYLAGIRYPLELLSHFPLMQQMASTKSA